METIKKFTPVQRSELLQLQLADDSIDKVTVDRDAVLNLQVNKDLIAVKKIPCVEFDDDVVEAPEFKVKYELDNNGLKTATLVKNYISTKKIRKLKQCDNNVKVLPIIDMQCVGVKCGEGQECSEGRNS